MWRSGHLTGSFYFGRLQQRPVRSQYFYERSPDMEEDLSDIQTGSSVTYL
ncbi:hypothetical protein EXN66_Car011619 [Channa argus]|uniref:Uncharacterized protein n=1 Tax=Channa argus TaxID=215402 RepID=A0A6G1Q0N1_CHAAH|nr:hypothetical protein EXN66_Car011619 [Channa argus]